MTTMKILLSENLVRVQRQLGPNSVDFDVIDKFISTHGDVRILCRKNHSTGIGRQVQLTTFKASSALLSMMSPVLKSLLQERLDTTYRYIFLGL